MLLLPLEEDALLFHVCLYYGLLVLLLELLVPLVFKRRVRIDIPRLALRGPVVPLSTREFQQRRLALQQQLAALQRALAETPRRSPHKRRQLLSASAVKNRLTASPSPSSSPLASPTSSVKVSRLETARNNTETKQNSDRKLKGPHEQGQYTSERRRREEVTRLGEGEQAPIQPPMAMGETLATRTVQQGGFSFDEAVQGDIEEKREDTQLESADWEQAMNRRTARRRESPTFSGRRPVRLVSEDGESFGYSGPSEASARLEALIGARRKRRASTLPTVAPPPPPPLVKPVRDSPLVRPPTVASAAEKHVGHSVTLETNPVQEEISSTLGQLEEHPIANEDEETKASEQREPLNDFQAFCASFAAGGSDAARQAAAKRKHHEAFELENDQAFGAKRTAQQQQYKQPRVTENYELSDSTSSRADADSQNVKPPKHYEAFESDDELAIDEALADQRTLESLQRTHQQAFGTEEKEDRPQEKTPRIVRRISFTDEVDALAASSPKEAAGERSIRKRTREKAFGMIDEDEEDAEWRDSLAFRPHEFG